MSASNYAKCPRCQEALDGTVRTLMERHADEYGTIPVADYNALQDQLAEAVIKAKAGSSTFREDYEIYGADDGVVRVSYGGSCEECGLTLSFYCEHPIPGAGHQS